MSLKDRLRRLEAARFPSSTEDSLSEEWPLDDQLEQVADTLDRFIYFHSKDEVRYVATDREIHLLGLLCAAWRSREVPLGEDGGEGEGFLVDVPRQIRAQDLPEWALEHFERMDPKKQAERERWLFAHRHTFEPWRESVRRVEEGQRRRGEESRRRDREFLDAKREAEVP